MPTVKKSIRQRVLRAIKKNHRLRLDLGCGPNKVEGAFGIDQRDLPGVDLVWNLEVFPWPLPDHCADTIFLSHYWEHVHPQKTLPFMAELHRVAKPGAQVLIAGPYAAEFRFVQDPTHCNPSNEATFLYWDKADSSQLWQVYRPPVLHVDDFKTIPVGNSRDFNAILRVCKPELAKCRRCGEGPDEQSGPGRRRKARA